MTRQAITARLLQLRRQLGAGGLAALALVGAAALFQSIALEPLQARSALLSAELARHTGARQRAEGGAASSAAGKLETFYSYLGRSEAPTDWLAKLYGIAKATGVELQSANYKTQAAGSRLERYEMVLPVSGSYPQLRDFLKRALAEIPVLSLDQMTLRREGRNEGAVQAELRMTLHLVKQ
jgi:hypothetical protein